MLKLRIAELFSKVEQALMIRILYLGLFASTSLVHASEDVFFRAQRSAFIPSVSLSYSYRQDLPQVFFAGLTWEFDESLFGDRLLVAIQIKRIEREMRFVKQIPTLD